MSGQLQDGPLREPASAEDEGYRQRLLEIAGTGEGADSLTRRILRSLPKDDFGQSVRAEVALARRIQRDRRPAESVPILTSLGEWFLDSGLPQVAAALLGLATSFSETDPEAQDLISCKAGLRNTIGLLAFRLGERDVARDHFLACLDLAQAAGADGWQAAARLNLANVARAEDDHVAAREHSRRSLMLYQEIGDTQGEVQLLLTLGNIAVEQGDTDEGWDWLRQVEPRARSLRQADLTASTLALRGRLEAQRADFASAERSFSLSRAAAKRANDADKQVVALQCLSAVAFDTERRGTAYRRQRAAAELAERHLLVGRLEYLLPSLVRSAANLKDTTAALAFAERLHEIASTRDSFGQGDAELLLGAALADSDRPAEAIAHLLVSYERLSEAATPQARELLVNVVWNLIWCYETQGELRDHAESLEHWASELPSPEDARLLERLGLALAGDPRSDPEVIARVLIASLHRRPRNSRAWAAQLIASQLETSIHTAVPLAVMRVGQDAARRLEQVSMARAVRNDLATALARDGSFRRAEKLLRANLDAAIADDDHASVGLSWYNLAEVYRQLEEEDLAVTAATNALALAEDADDVRAAAAARLQLALTLLDKSEWTQAQAILEPLTSENNAGPTVRSGAFASLATIAMSNRDYSAAVDLLRRSLGLHERSPIHRAENLLSLSESHAGASDRRAFRRDFQRAVDALDELSFDVDHASRVIRCARRWHEHGKSAFAGEVIADCILLGARDAARRASGGEQPLWAGLIAAAVEFNHEVSEGADKRALESVVRKSLHEVLSRSIARFLLRQWRDARRELEADAN